MAGDDVFAGGGFEFAAGFFGYIAAFFGGDLVFVEAGGVYGFSDLTG